MMNDRDIIELYWQRAESAISETARRYGSYCRRIALNILGNDEDCEECLNDTWLKAWESIPPQRPQQLSAFSQTITSPPSMMSFLLFTMTSAIFLRTAS